MKRTWLLVFPLLAVLAGCGTSTQPSPPPLSAEQQARVAAKAFATILKQEYGYNTVSSDIDDEEADKAKKKGKAKATKSQASNKAPSSKPATPKQSSSITPSATAATTTTTTAAAKRIYVLEVIFEERGCKWEAQKKLGDADFKIDETTDKAGEEVDVDFEAVSPTNAQFLAWVDLPSNRVKFDCYTPA